MTFHSFKPYEVIPFWDRAIDVKRSDLAKYVSSRDMSALVFYEGKHPTRFVCRQIPNAMAIDQLLGETRLDLRRKRAFQLSVTAVRNAKLRDGREIPEWAPARAVELERSALDQTPEVVTDRELELFDIPTILEVGEVILGHCFLPHGITGGYLLPPTSRQLLAAMEDLYAALVQSMAPSGAITSQPAPEASSPGGGAEEPGGAAATGSAIDSPEPKQNAPSAQSDASSST